MSYRTCLILILGLAACGGRVLDQQGTDGESGGTAGAPAASLVAGASGGAGRAGSSKPLPTHPLSPCVPGFDRARNPERACNWADAKGACFEEMDDACACICPDSTDSICWSSFPDPGQAVPVYCE